MQSEKLAAVAAERITDSLKELLEEELRRYGQDLVGALVEDLSEIGGRRNGRAPKRTKKHQRSPKRTRRKQQKKQRKGKRTRRNLGKLQDRIDKMIGLLSKKARTKKHLLDKLGIQTSNLRLLLTSARGNLKKRGLTIESEGRGDGCTYRIEKL